LLFKDLRTEKPVPRQNPLKPGRLSFSLLLLVGFLLLTASTAPARERDWQPQRTWVFIVGTLTWQHSEMFESFPQQNRRDAQLADFFRQQGVPAEQMVYLQDEQATTRRVRNEFSEMLARTTEGDLLFVYFTGHGYKSDDERQTFFATYNASDKVPGWSTESIISDINQSFHGSRVLLTADCCYSGSLVKDARRLNNSLSYACLTSSLASESSTEHWTFTEALLAGLRGRAYEDINGDGEITLGEIADNAREDLAFAEKQRSSFASRGDFSGATILAAAAPRSSAELGKRVEVRSEGDWYKALVVDARAGRFQVHYYGFEVSDDEWVLPRQIRNSQIVAGASGEISWERQTEPTRSSRAGRRTEPTSE
jgi:caspase domain-containing protein